MSTEATLATAQPTSQTTHGAGFGTLLLGSIGVVYGDIGTSPLYAFREATVAASGGPGQAVSEAAVLGVLSLILWALILIVTVKYVFILLRCDNNGEGGTLALATLAQRAIGTPSKVVLVIGLIGAGLFYGDAMITPAISVLSAVEGLKIATPVFEPYVVPITVVILVALFTMQWRGTGKVAQFFGPITTLWFVVIALIGAMHVADDPRVLEALNPAYGFFFLMENGLTGLLALGAVFLAVTGAEALYADLGHFGRKPIQYAWLFLVLPALALNYFGQAAFVLANPTAIENPFFLMLPNWALLPMVGLATVATVIASQAVITGAFSLTSQAIQLGLLPRLEVRHTSHSQAGQIYIPRVNAILLVGVLLLVATFGTSSELAGAYGVAVTAEMVVTALLAFVVIWKGWGWGLAAAAALMMPFLVMDLTFLSANLLKIFQGGWAPLTIGAAVVTLMLTWRKGVQVLRARTRRQEMPLMDLVELLEAKPPARVEGTAVYLTSDRDYAPTALLHSLKHYKVLHEKNIILTIVTEDTPRVLLRRRVSVEPVSGTFSRLILRIGFMEMPNTFRALELVRELGWDYNPAATSFFLSRRTLRRDPKCRHMPFWQASIFLTLAQNADDASNYFRLPSDRVVEIGTQVTL